MVEIFHRLIIEPQNDITLLETRIAGEYKLRVGFEAAPYQTARWVEAASDADLKAFSEANRGSMAEDRDGAPVFLARNAWELNYTTEKWPDIKLVATRERA